MVVECEHWVNSDGRGTPKLARRLARKCHSAKIFILSGDLYTFLLKLCWLLSCTYMLLLKI